MQNRLLRALLLLIVVGFTAAGCETPTDLAIESGRPSYGAQSNPDISEYYYPHHAGVTYVYSNKLVIENGQNTTSVRGDNDTVRTLGQQGYTSTGEPVYAISITYKASLGLAGHNITPLRYLPSSSSFGGAFINSALLIDGELTTAPLATRATSTDSTTTPCYGRLRSLASDLSGSGQSVWQTDIIYYTSNATHVAFWEKTASGSFIRSKDLFRSDIAVSNGNEWSYSTWQSSTKISVVSSDRSITVGSTNLTSIHTRIDNANLNVGSTSEKYFAPGYGQVRQVDTWFTTTDGVNRVKTSLIRDGIVIRDLDEVLSM